MLSTTFGAAVYGVSAALITVEVNGVCFLVNFSITFCIKPFMINITKSIKKRLKYKPQSYYSLFVFRLFTFSDSL
jgi:hypothetical protein